MSHYYRMEHEPSSVHITDEPRDIPNTVEISEDDYLELLAHRTERDISEEVQYMMPINKIIPED